MSGAVLGGEMSLRTWLSGAKWRVAPVDAELIALNVFAPQGADKSWLVAHDDIAISSSQCKVADEMVSRCAEGCPIAYVLGKKEFYGREFAVDAGVLIPRPETETLIDLIKELKLSQRPRFLEIGTGSGCIAVTLALEFPQAEVLATDLSEDALAVAEKNDAKYEGRVEFRCSDLLKEVNLAEDGPFDLVVANLPYVNPDWDWLEKRSLGYEPATALYALEENGLSLYRRLLEELAEQGESFGSLKYLAVETDVCQQEALDEMAGEYGWKLLKRQGYGSAYIIKTTGLIA